MVVEQLRKFANSDSETVSHPVIFHATENSMENAGAFVVEAHMQIVCCAPIAYSLLIRTEDSMLSSGSWDPEDIACSGSTESVFHLGRTE